MCGIVGILHKYAAQHIVPCTDQLGHRGPDDHGTFILDNLALGHRRLAIQDLSPNGHQPFISEDGNFVMVFNGEIYNHKEIRADLKGQHTFKSHSDTETILYAYIEMGPRLFTLLNGIFALAIFDIRKKELLLCRDHFGVKPLYYHQSHDMLFFGSEIKSFLSIPGWDKSLDHQALLNYIQFLYSPGEATPFAHIRKFPPGHYAIVNTEQNNSIEFIKYYDIPFDDSRLVMDEAEYISALDEHLHKAISRQLLSDVPVGFFLSGGLDSSILVAIAKKYTDRKIKCFTIDTDFKEGDGEGFSNDLYFAKKVASHLDVDLDIVKADIDIVNDFDKMIWHLDEPQADAAPLNVYNICRKAREQDRIVLLGGTAGDDLFSGYRRHQALNFEKYFQLVPDFLGSPIHALANQLPTSIPALRRMKKLLGSVGMPSVERLASYYNWLPFDATKSLFKSDLSATFSNPGTILKESLKNISNEKELLNYLLFWDMKYFLTDHNLNYTDKMSMAHGVEVRVPFLDVELVNFSTKMPVSLKMKGHTTKYILKKTAEKYLPKEVIYRPKTGFGAPVRKWITNDMDEMIHDFLSEENIVRRGIFDHKQVHALIQKNKEGKIDASYPIWALLAIESWMRQFID